jgi:toxin ParE1/3/4
LSTNRSNGRGYGTSSEYIRELIRKDQDRQNLRQLLLDGAQSEPTEPVDATYFERLRDRVRARRAGMTTRLVIPRAVARRDIEAVLDYYVDTAGVEVALKFVASLESAYRIIAERPATGSARFAHELDLPGMRSRMLARFPYLLFYFDRSEPRRRVAHSPSHRDIPSWLAEREN